MAVDAQGRTPAEARQQRQNDSYTARKRRLLQPEEDSTTYGGSPSTFKTVAKSTGSAVAKKIAKQAAKRIAIWVAGMVGGAFFTGTVGWIIVIILLLIVAIVAFILS